jgi:hypothetical protein
MQSDDGSARVIKTDIQKISKAKTAFTKNEILGCRMSVKEETYPVP